MDLNARRFITFITRSNPVEMSRTALTWTAAQVRYSFGFPSPDAADRVDVSVLFLQ